MRMFGRWHKGLMGLTAILAAAASAQAPQTDPTTLEEIRHCMQNNLPEKTFSQQVRLMSQDAAGGQQILNARLYGTKSPRGTVDLMLSVEEPADLAGARYLLVGKDERDDMYVYLPAVGRVRRVIGGMRGQPLWGTDFSYEDIKHLQNVLIDARTEYSGPADRQGRRVNRLKLYPPVASESVYSHIELDVDAQTCLIVEARFFDEAGEIKRMHCAPDQFTQVNERWVFGQVRMQNLRGGTHSELTLANVEYDERLSRQLFNPKTFYLSR